MSIETSELFLRTSASESSSDSDQSQKYRTNFVRPGSEFTAPSKKETARIVKEINAKLESGESIDINDYPPLYVAHYRGIHFFKKFFSQEERQEMRSAIKQALEQQDSYSPAVYERAGLKMGEAIDTKEKREKVKEAIGQLNEEFDLLEKTSPSDYNWWGNEKKTADCELFQLYQRYVNSYEKFREENIDKTEEPYKKLTTTSNPFISTADGPKHAVSYALGAKAKMTHDPLRPGYDKTLQAKHPKVGYVEVILHKISALHEIRHMPLSTLQASRKVEIKTRILNERETTFWAVINKEHIVARELVRFPSMNIKYSEYMMNRYGFSTAQSYSRIANSLKAHKNTKLVSNLGEHFGKNLQNIAALKAHEMGKGLLIFMGLDGKLKTALPTTMDISNVKASDKADLLFSAYKEGLQHIRPPVKKTSLTKKASPKKKSRSRSRKSPPKKVATNSLEKKIARLSVKDPGDADDETEKKAVRKVVKKTVKKPVRKPVKKNVKAETGLEEGMSTLSIKKK